MISPMNARLMQLSASVPAHGAPTATSVARPFLPLKVTLTSPSPLAAVGTTEVQLAVRHPRGATVSCFDGSADFITYDYWLELLTKTPGPLYCSPRTANGVTPIHALSAWASSGIAGGTTSRRRVVGTGQCAKSRSRQLWYMTHGERGSGQMRINGAAARLVQPGDTIIVISYAHYDERELDEYRPRVVHVERNTNRIVAVDDEVATLLA